MSLDKTDLLIFKQASSGQRTFRLGLSLLFILLERRNKVLKKYRIAVIAFVLGVFFSFAGTAMAEMTLSNTKYLGTVNGYTYTADGYTESSYGWGVRGYSVITCSDGSVPTGYMGISSYVYNSSGACVVYSPWSYNTSSVQSIGTFTNWYSVSGDYYNSKGSCKMYNGNGYTEVPSNYTPYLYY